MDAVGFSRFSAALRALLLRGRLGLRLVLPLLRGGLVAERASEAGQLEAAAVEDLLRARHRDAEVVLLLAVVERLLQVALLLLDRRERVERLAHAVRLADLRPQRDRALVGGARGVEVALAERDPAERLLRLRLAPHVAERRGEPQRRLVARLRVLVVLL